ncbi:hypothetical protein B0H12DRAFT_733647 [Mycena haematopus]|nr:hypothetical protein B0H12DRAFT_733647 [Mycena haematopus]
MSVGRRITGLVYTPPIFLAMCTLQASTWVPVVNFLEMPNFLQVQSEKYIFGASSYLCKSESGEVILDIRVQDLIPKTQDPDFDSLDEFPKWPRLSNALILGIQGGR